MYNEPTPHSAEPVEPSVQPASEALAPATTPNNPENGLTLPDDASLMPPEMSVPTEFSWEASEYVHHHKNNSWYVGVVAVVIVLSIGGYLLKAWLSIALFIVMGATVIIFAKRPPRTLTYLLSPAGLTIDGKLYPYSNFRSFAIMRDVAWHTIDLEPTQRFMPRMSVLFDDENLELITAHLTAYLPQIDREPDFIERATRFLRF